MVEGQEEDSQEEHDLRTYIEIYDDDSRKSHRVATLHKSHFKRTKQVEVTSGTDDMWRETMKGSKIPRERKAPTRIRKPTSSGAGWRTGVFCVATMTKITTIHISQEQPMRPPCHASKK